MSNSDGLEQSFAYVFISPHLFISAHLLGQPWERLLHCTDLDLRDHCVLATQHLNVSISPSLEIFKPTWMWSWLSLLVQGLDQMDPKVCSNLSVLWWCMRCQEMLSTKGLQVPSTPDCLLWNSPKATEELWQEGENHKWPQSSHFLLIFVFPLKIYRKGRPWQETEVQYKPCWRLLHSS